jgi:hypothetical protein
LFIGVIPAGLIDWKLRMEIEEKKQAHGLRGIGG